MTSEHLVLHEKPSAQYLIAGWGPQWSDGGEISSGLPQYLIDKLGARKIGEMGKSISMMCYPFQVPGTHDAFRPGATYNDGLPVQGDVQGKLFLRCRKRPDYISRAKNPGSALTFTPRPSLRP